MSLNITDYTPKFEFTSRPFTALTAEQFVSLAVEVQEAMDGGLSPSSTVEITPDGNAWKRLKSTSGGHGERRVEPEETK